MVQFDAIIDCDMIVNVTRTIDRGQTVYPDTIDRIIADFGAAMGELRCIGSERLVKAGVSMTQLHMLSMLVRHGDTTMSRLAAAIDASLSNVTGLVDRMEQRGYVERFRVPDDRRVIMIRVTPQGRAMLDEIEALRSDLFRGVLDGLPDERLDGLRVAAADLRAAVETYVADPSVSVHDHATPPTTDRRI
jgi:DNA-binding MarR family transcriptional regulator